MAAPKRCIAQLSSLQPIVRYQATQPSCLRTLVPYQQTRSAGVTGKHSENAAKYKRRNEEAVSKKKKKARPNYMAYDLEDADQFSLCDAMRYIRAFEVGRAPTSPKYELHIKLRTARSGPVIRNRLRLPHPIRTDLRIAVICPADSPAAESALKAGASLVGEDSIFSAVKDGQIDFDRCICHPDSLQKLNKAGLGRILGPKGLMPSTKFGTVTKDVAGVVRDMVGGSEYRERMGVVRMAVGQLGFSPEEMQRNIRTFVESVRKDAQLMSERIVKEVHEVVLSSTHAPGFSLDGSFRSEDSVPTKDLAVV